MLDIFLLCFILYIIGYLIWDFIFKFLCKIFLFKPKHQFSICDTTFKNLNKFMIRTSDNILLDGYILGCNSDIYILYAHGKNGDIYSNMDFINELLKFGNVVVFDYRGFGMSNGSPTEGGFYIDAYSIWNFLVDVKKIDPNKIILFGENVGCTVLAWLGQYLIKLNKPLPRSMIFQSVFTSLKDLVNDYSVFLSSFIDNQFDTFQHIKQIYLKIPILILSNKENELTHHVLKLSKFGNCYIHETKTNNYLKFDDDLISVLMNFIQRPYDYVSKDLKINKKNEKEKDY